ncbi:MAG: hypothetical protein ABIQ31_04895 [Ferruginibacter sp.]
MKTSVLLVICVIIICITTYGQDYGAKFIAIQTSGQANPSPQTNSGNDTAIFSRQNNSTAYKELSTKRGSLLNFLNVQKGWNILSCDIFKGGIFKSSKHKYSRRPDLVFLKQVTILPQGIPYLLNWLTNDNNVAFKVRCQKISYGASNKSCKKVTGITFCFPIAANE